MAKKKVGGPKAKRAAKGNPVEPFVLNVTNLKFIGVAFDEAIRDLDAIKDNARNKRGVAAAITKLKRLRLATARVCPQTWYKSFDIK